MLTDKQRADVAALAKELGADEGELMAEAEKMAADTGPEKTDKPGEPAATGAESGAKAHGGRGYFAYEYPFLKVNEIRASLFVEPIEDGELFSGEWLAKHSGGTGAPSGTPPTE